MVEKRITEASLDERDTSRGCKVAAAAMLSALATYKLSEWGLSHLMDPSWVSAGISYTAAGLGGILGAGRVANWSNPVVSWEEIESLYRRIDNLAHTVGEIVSERDSYHDKWDWAITELDATRKARDGALRSLEKVTGQRDNQRERGDKLQLVGIEMAGRYNLANNALYLANTANALNFFARGRSYQEDLREKTPDVIRDELFTLVAEENLGSADIYSSGLFVTSNGYGITTARSLDGIGEGRNFLAVDKDSIQYSIDPESVTLDKRHNLALFKADRKDKDPRATPIFVENKLRYNPGSEITAFYPSNSGVDTQKGTLGDLGVDIKNREAVSGVALTNFDQAERLMGAPVLDEKYGLTGFVSYTGEGEDTRVAFTPINYANNLMVREVTRLSNLIESRE